MENKFGSAHVILNAGLHSHNFDNATEQEQVKVALEEIGLPGIWKTTSYTKQELLLEHRQMNDNISLIRSSDVEMCRVLGRCLNLSWTVRLRPELYFDGLHFQEPVYRIFNEDLLQQLHQLPLAYLILNRTDLLMDT
jgi:hypothetical protein